MDQKQAQLVNKFSKYPLNPNVQLEDVTEEEEEQEEEDVLARSRSNSAKRKRSPKPGFRRSSRLRNKKKTANTKSRSPSPSSSGRVSLASQSRKKTNKRRKRSRSSSSGGSRSPSRSRSQSPSPDGLYTLLHKVNGSVIKFISNVPFVNNKLPKKACRYFTKSCMERILTKRDKKKKNVTVLLKKINTQRQNS